ncbi:hypothetical protein AB0442_08225 [Kitasatospora sp. NPDC085895]|uniref:hypothetical protein n=1 Tax=Kitasatospora sp. NPDC085895 TaxID=3155057 RepID=UPI00344D18C3
MAGGVLVLGVLRQSAAGAAGLLASRLLAAGTVQYGPINPAGPAELFVNGKAL